MFQFPTYASSKLDDEITLTGLPHSDTRGSQCLGHSPQLFAALRVLLRLQEPRHPPYALLLDLLLKGSLCLPVGRPELLLTFDGLVNASIAMKH